MRLKGVDGVNASGVRARSLEREGEYQLQEAHLGLPLSTL